MANSTVDASAPPGAAVAPGKPRRRNKPQHSSQNVADLVHVALVAKQRDEERALVTQTRRRKRAFKKHKRTEQSTDAGTIGTAAQTRSLPVDVGDDGEAGITVMVEKLVTPEELEDSDEFEDIVADLTVDFQSFGRLLSLETARDTGVITLTYANLEVARTAVHGKHGKLFGGREVVARLAVAPADDQDAVMEPTTEVHEQHGPANASDVHMKKKKRRSKVKNTVLKERDSRRLQHSTFADAEMLLSKFFVHNLITSDEVEREDELSELQDDARAEFAAFGVLAHLEIVTRTTLNSVDYNVEASSCTLAVQDAGDVVVEFQDPDCAAIAFRAYDGKVFGGRMVTCQWLVSTPPRSSHVVQAQKPASHTIQVTNMLSPDELQDPDEADDLQDEVTELFGRHGVIVSLEICRISGVVTVEYESLETAQQTVAKVNESVYGGRRVEARVSANTRAAGDTESSRSELQRDMSKAERLFAVVPLQGDLVDVVVQFLKRLAGLQQRAHQQNPLQGKRSRRLVLGLHEVKRGLLANKLKLLLVGTDIEECGALDEKVSEILTIAHREQVPVAFPMTRRKLGRVLSKTVRVSCVGVYSFDGANDLFAEITRHLSLAGHS